MHYKIFLFSSLNPFRYHCFHRSLKDLPDTTDAAEATSSRTSSPRSPNIGQDPPSTAATRWRSRSSTPGPSPSHDSTPPGSLFVKPGNNDSDNHDGDDDVNRDDDNEGWVEGDALPPPHPSAMPYFRQWLGGRVGGRGHNKMLPWLCGREFASRWWRVATRGVRWDMEERDYYSALWYISASIHFRFKPLD